MAVSNFGKAFKAARASGKKEFTFGGKRYHTRTADEEKKTAAPAKASAAKPAAPAKKAYNYYESDEYKNKTKAAAKPAAKKTKKK